MITLPNIGTFHLTILKKLNPDLNDFSFDKKIIKQYYYPEWTFVLRIQEHRNMN
jgi:hypothetical protein